MSSITSTLSLSSGNKIPCFGFGVWDSPSNLTTTSCLEALKVGYRHIDTAQVYGNESEVGEALKKSNIPRKDIFVTSKILSPGRDADATLQKCLDSIEKIDGKDGYIDLMLIHNSSAGAEGIKKMWQAMEQLHAGGRLKSIGVSNFGAGHIDQMKSYAKSWPPAVNQIELHPWCQQREICDYCSKNNIAIEAYCPLVRNQKAEDPTLKSVADKHQKSTQQVLLRYCLQKNWVPLPKSDTPKRIASNADVFDFELGREEMGRLDDQKQEPALVVQVDNKSTQ